MLYLNIILLASGFLCLWYGGQALLKGSENIAIRFHIPEFLIGATLVAFGTSAPELVVNIIASLSCKSDIILGNVIGSNIANILLGIGLAALLFQFKFKRNTFSKEIIISFLSIIFFWILTQGLLLNKTPKTFSRLNGIFFLIFFFFFLYNQFKSGKTNLEIPNKTKSKISTDVILFLIGIILLPLGGQLSIKATIYLANFLGVSEILISIFALAIGTSLPEIFTSIQAVSKGKSELAIGNIIGSNIFNILLVLGTCGIINPIKYNPILNLDIVILIVSSILLFAFIKLSSKNKITKIEAVTLLAIYCAYIAYIFYRG
jgi:cation:H+ antiporter